MVIKFQRFMLYECISIVLMPVVVIIVRGAYLYCSVIIPIFSFQLIGLYLLYTIFFGFKIHLLRYRFQCLKL